MRHSQSQLPATAPCLDQARGNGIVQTNSLSGYSIVWPNIHSSGRPLDPRNPALRLRPVDTPAGTPALCHRRLRAGIHPVCSGTFRESSTIREDGHRSSSTGELHPREVPL